jgi:hypothetical protein
MPSALRKFVASDIVKEGDMCLTQRQLPYNFVDDTERSIYFIAKTDELAMEWHVTQAQEVEPKE